MNDYEPDILIVFIMLSAALLALFSTYEVLKIIIARS